MPAKINTIISAQSFELVRDRIGLILAEEMANQEAMSYDEDLALQAVWIERTNPIDFTETPCLVVSLADLTSSQTSKTAQDSQEITRYNIDVYTGKNSVNGSSGSVLSRLQAQKILGVCRVILEDSRYRTLDFPPPSLTRVKAASIVLANADPADTQNTTMGRLVLEVHGTIGLNYGDTVPLDGSDTQVKLFSTELGLKYTYQS